MIATRPCAACGTWACPRCGWRRRGVPLPPAAQACTRCGAHGGTVTPDQHARPRWEEHNPAADWDDTRAAEPGRS